MRLKPRLFLDTSALFAGIWSAAGGGRMLLKLGEAGAVQLLVSSQVLEELESVMRRKAEQNLPLLAVLMDRSQISVVESAPSDLAALCRELIPQAGDARILADAWHNQTEFLVTLDRAHFMGAPAVTEKIPFTIGTPGDCLAWYRNNLRAASNPTG
jgi:predicted nucleic acid-binding protein